VFNVVPWVVTMFSSIFSGWLADYMLGKGQFMYKKMQIA
jgi:hypothetical protein